MKRKQLLFSKREKAEKSTTMGQEDENLGKPLIMNLNYTKGEYIIIRIVFNIFKIPSYL